jgi:hypothetical protein
VEALVLVAMLTLVASHRVLNQMRLMVPEKSDHFTPMRWAETFYAAALKVMNRVLEYAGIDDDLTMIMMFFIDEGVDPNVNRKRLLSPWVKSNSQGLNTSK